MSALFDSVLARGGARDALSDAAWLRAMLDVEAALARASAAAGLIGSDEAEAIVAACRAELFDVGAIGEAAAAAGNPVVPLVSALAERVGGAAGALVHRGATSQDVLDSAAMLVAHRALDPVLEDLAAAGDAAARLAEAHRSTPMVGRTLLQQASPVTFGLAAAGWLIGLDEAAGRLRALREERLAAQLGGATGTLAGFGDAGLEVLARFAAELGLAEPVLPWHTTRTRVGELAGVLAVACGAVAKPARDVVLLAQTEVAEVREGAEGRGGSSTMPHKRNPVAAISALAAAHQAPGLATTLIAAMEQEHQRAAGAWHAEWRPLRELLVCTGSAAAWLRDCLEHLDVDPIRMRANLDAAGGLPLAERVAAELAPLLGRETAHAAVREAAAAGGAGFADALGAHPRITADLDPTRLAELLDAERALGSATALVDRALRHHGGQP